MDPTLREKIDSIDEQLVRLFAERMETAAKIAEYKKEHGIPVLDRKRENECGFLEYAHRFFASLRMTGIRMKG